MIIFTDLDGTLLSSDSYSFADALPALKEIRRKDIPLIICSSKTRAEVEVYLNKLSLNHPFISENGGAIFIPRGYFSRSCPQLEKRGKYLVWELGLPYQELRKRLLQVRRKFPLLLLGFGDLGAKDIVSLCNMSLTQARLAKKREYDEPFFFSGNINKKTKSQILKAFGQLRLNVTSGGRFFHLMGRNDKGTAVRKLRRLFKDNYGSDIPSAGIGDSLNDLALLESVDIPILVQLDSKTYHQGIANRVKPILAGGVGPIGWNKAVLHLIRKFYGP